MIGRKIEIWWDGEVWKSPVVVLEKYKNFYIVRFASKEITGVEAGADGAVHRVTGVVITAATVQKYLATHADEILATKKDIDAMGG